jgi:hypothetical protein
MLARTFAATLAFAAGLAVATHDAQAFRAAGTFGTSVGGHATFKRPAGFTNRRSTARQNRVRTVPLWGVRAPGRF